MNTRGLKQIGKGAFSKVYLMDKQVLIKSSCHVKECISHEWHNSTGVFPKLIGVDFGEYLCEYYPPVKSLKESLCTKHWEIYKDLRGLSVGHVRNRYDLLDEWRKQFKKVKDKKFRNALLDMTDQLCNWGTRISFEISPRNVAVKNGKLILLDVFFFEDQLDDVKQKRRLSW